MIDWNRHKSADYATVTFFDEVGKAVGFKRFDRPTQTKTVADAVEEFPDGWYSIPYDTEVEVPYEDELLLCAKKDFYDFGEKYTKGNFYRGAVDFESEYFYQVCTREQFEAYLAGVEPVGVDIDKDALKAQYKSAVKGQEDEKWTHKTNAGELCKIHVKEPDVNGVIIVINERGEYLRHNSDSLKPIKPTITKADAWDLCQDYEGSQGMVKYMLDLHEQYEII